MVEIFGNLENENKPRKMKNGIWDENFDRKFGVWKIKNGWFLNLKERMPRRMP